MDQPLEDWSASAPLGVGAFFIPSVDSTNAMAAAEASRGQVGPTWYVAGEQTGGRGRRGRAWVSAPGNLYASLLWRPHLAAEDLTALPFITVLAVRDAAISLGIAPVRLTPKWPNDLLLDGRKISGILIETSVGNGGVLDHVIVGIGVNLAHHPDGVDFKATDLASGAGVKASAREFLAALAASFVRRVNEWDVRDFRPIRDEWSSVAWGIGERRAFRLATETVTGTMLDLGADGGLKVRLDDGGVISLYAGDVFPAGDAGPKE